MNHFRAVCTSVRNKAVNEVEQLLDKYTEEDGKINVVNIDFINSNAKSPNIIAKLKISGYQNSVNISYKIDIGSNSNYYYHYYNYY